MVIHFQIKFGTQCLYQSLHDFELSVFYHKRWEQKCLHSFEQYRSWFINWKKKIFPICCVCTVHRRNEPQIHEQKKIRTKENITNVLHWNVNNFSQFIGWIQVLYEKSNNSLKYFCELICKLWIRYCVRILQLFISLILC